MHFYYGKLYERKVLDINYYPINEPRTNNITFYPDQNIVDQKTKNIKINTIHKTNNDNSIHLKRDSQIFILNEDLDSKNSNSFLYSSTANLIPILKEKGKSKSKIMNENNKIKKKPTVNRLSFNNSPLEKEEKKTSCFMRLNEGWVFKSLITILLIHVGFFLYVYNFSYEIMSDSEHIYFVNYSSLCLKSVVYFASSAILSTCMLKDMSSKQIAIKEFSLTYDEYRFKLSLRTDEILYLYGNMKDYLNEVIQITEEIDSALFDLEEFKIIYNDWTQYTRQSSLDSEIIYLRNYLFPLATPPSLEKCTLANFYNEKFKSENPVEKEDFVLFYILKNVFNNYRKNFELISYKSTELIMKYQDDIKSYFSITNFLLLFLSVLMLFLMFIEIKILQAKILFNIEKILDFELEKFEKVEIIMQKYIGLIEDFNTEKCSNFELCKLNTETNEDKKSLNPPVVNRLKARTLPEDSEIEEYKIKSLKIEIISKILLLFGLIVYALISFFQLFTRQAHLQDILDSNKISINILERMSDLTELDLYYKFSVILNDPYFITVTQEDYDALSKLNIYDKFSSNADELYSVAKDSYFSLVYYKITQIYQNIDYFRESNNKDILMKTREHESILFDKDFCNKTSTFFYQNSYSCSSEEECNSLIQAGINECNNELNKNGFKLGYLASLNNLKNYFIDFVKQPKETRTVIDNLYNKDILVISQNIDGNYKKLHTNVINTVRDDMSDLYSRLRNSESLFTFIQIGFDFAFLSFIFLVIFLKLKRHSITLERFYVKFEKNLGLGE